LPALLKTVKRLGDNTITPILPLFASFVDNFDPRPYSEELLQDFFAFSKKVSSTCKWLSRVQNLESLIVRPIDYKIEQSGAIIDEFLTRP